MILTQTMIEKQLRRLNLKVVLGRQRLRLSLQELSFYCCAILEQVQTQTTFQSIHLRLQGEGATPVQYSTFMHHVQTCAKLLPILFNEVNQTLGIKPSSLYNIVDSTLIPEKEEKYITAQDWGKNRVTTRVVQKNKIHICGSKGLVFLNRKHQVTQAQILPINTSDQNIFKDPLLYLRQLDGVLLADRGFNSALVRSRIQAVSRCRFISPYLKKQKVQLTQKEQKFYKRRWAIETVFQKLKHVWSETQLNLRGKYSRTLKKAQFYSTLTLYNLAHA